MKRKTFSWLLIAGMILTSPPVFAQMGKQTAPPAQAEKAAAAAPQATTQTPPEPDPLQILRKASDFLKSQKQFSYKAEVTDDEVYYGGKKLQYGFDVETLVRRPDRMRVNAEGDVVNKQFFFDGESITLYDKDENVYATEKVPHDIEGALDKAHKEYNLRVALADLASPRLGEHIGNGLKNTLYVGLHKVRGIPCHHLAFDRDDIQFQVWIDAGDKPLPRKIVINQKQLPGSPQWIAYLTDWNFSPHLKDSQFVFVPPQGAEKIKFISVKAAVETQSAKPGPAEAERR